VISRRVDTGSDAFSYDLESTASKLRPASRIEQRSNQVVYDDKKLIATL